MINKSIKRIGGIALFSTMLSIGIGVIPLGNEMIVHAEGKESKAYSLYDSYKKTEVDNVFIGSVELLNNSEYMSYDNVVQKINGDKALVIDVGNPFFEGNPSLGHYPTFKTKVARRIVKHDFKAGDKFKIKVVMKDPLKLKKLEEYESKRKFYLDSMSRGQVYLFNEQEENFDIARQDSVDFKVNENNTELVIEYEFTANKDNSFLNPSVYETFFGLRNELNKEEESFKIIQDNLVGHDIIDIASVDMYITDENDNLIVEPFSEGKIKATNQKELAKNETKNFYSLVGLEFPPMKDSDQSVKANVLNGGITGGIVSTEVGKNLAIKDVDFGELSIGKVIEPIKEDSMVSVRDWTGGNGWKLTAQHKNADRNQSLQLGVQVNKNTKVDLNNEAQLVTSGESQLDVTTQGGEYTAKWGTHPTVGEFNNVIEWNLSANVTE